MSNALEKAAVTLGSEQEEPPITLQPEVCRLDKSTNPIGKMTLEPNENVR